MVKRSDFLRGAGLVAAASLAPVPAMAGPYEPPPPGFGSNRNYWIYASGEPIRNLRVIVGVDEDIVAPGSLSMQLNCNSRATDTCAYEQYVIGMNARQPRLGLNWSIENFPTKAFRWNLHTHIGFPCSNGAGQTEKTCKGNLYNYPPEKTAFATYPVESSRIPRGFRIVYDLFDDADGRVVAVTYTVIDANGRATSSGRQNIHSFVFAGTHTAVGPRGVGPAIAAQMNIVGLHGGAHTELQSGAGTITYVSSTPLTPKGSLHEMAGIYLGTPGTGETSNVLYAKLRKGYSQQIVQRFGLDQTALGPRGVTPCYAGQTYDAATNGCLPTPAGHLTNDQAPPQRPRR